jgi:RNA 2',3'-cyclic 3'-phosphodiesterase
VKYHNLLTILIMEKKRLFLGMEVIAPWPQSFPDGRILLETDRHLTLLFLGENDPATIIHLLHDFPDPGFRLGLAALFDRPVFLPHREPKTAGWHIRFLEQKEFFLDFRKKVKGWFLEKGLDIHEPTENFLAHVTIARPPFVIQDWKKAFQPLPLFLKNIQLYESLGSSHYKICWSHEILAPFEAIEHTADVAFLIRGTSFEQLFIHAALALAFQFPPLTRYGEEVKPQGLDELIYQLNLIVARADAAEGCPFKAVSYHSVMSDRENMLEWEMIVDV